MSKHILNISEAMSQDNWKNINQTYIVVTNITAVFDEFRTVRNFSHEWTVLYAKWTCE